MTQLLKKISIILYILSSSFKAYSFIRATRSMGSDGLGYSLIYSLSKH